MDNNVGKWSPEDGIGFAKIIGSEAKAPPEKRPLYRSLPPAPDFPLYALGPLEFAATAIQQLTQAPIAICAQSVLAAATLAAQAHRDVMLPGGGRKPLTAIFISVAESGERKSSVDRIALAGVHEVEAEWRQQAEIERESYMNAKAAWDTAREQAKRSNKGDLAALRASFEAIGPEPKAPPHPMLLIADPTPEALTQHLKDGRPMAGVFTAEGGLLIGGAAFTDESRMRTAALFNTLWDGDPIRRSRIGTGTTFLPGRRCSAHIMLQPVVADRLFGDSMLDGIGLTARILMVAPSSTAGTRLFREAPSETKAVLEAYNSRLRYLLKRPPVTHPDMPDALNPPAMLLHPRATTAWIEFHDQCEQAIKHGCYLAPIAAFAAKLAEHAGRLAAVLTIYHDPAATEVSLLAMQCGIALAAFYAQEMLRLHGGASVSPDLRMAQHLLSWWQKQPSPSLHLALIYQCGPAALREAKSARKAVEILEEHGWIERLAPGEVIDGAPRKEAWRLRP
jgi:hypothetical protein